jgi:hypothetical protein
MQLEIGVLNEGSLHRALKAAYRRPGDRVETPIDGFVVDLARDDLLIEIQTGSFGAMGRKLDHLLDAHRVLLVHPVAVDVVLHRDGRPARMSPKHQSTRDLFEELVSIPTLVGHPNLTIDVVSCRIARRQVPDPTMRRRRGGFRTVDQHLIEVLDIERFETPADLLALLPAGLPEPFTTADVARAGAITRRLAQKMAYCLEGLDLIVPIGRRRDGIHYQVSRGIPGRSPVGVPPDEDTERS